MASTRRPSSDGSFSGGEISDIAEQIEAVEELGWALDHSRLEATAEYAGAHAMLLFRR